MSGRGASGGWIRHHLGQVTLPQEEPGVLSHQSLSEDNSTAAPLLALGGGRGPDRIPPSLIFRQRLDREKSGLCGAAQGDSRGGGDPKRIMVGLLEEAWPKHKGKGKLLAVSCSATP